MRLIFSEGIEVMVRSRSTFRSRFPCQIDNKGGGVMHWRFTDVFLVDIPAQPCLVIVVLSRLVKKCGKRPIPSPTVAILNTTHGRHSVSISHMSCALTVGMWPESCTPCQMLLKIRVFRRNGCIFYQFWFIPSATMPWILNAHRPAERSHLSL